MEEYPFDKLFSLILDFFSEYNKFFLYYSFIIDFLIQEKSKKFLTLQKLFAISVIFSCKQTPSKKRWLTQEG